MRRNIPSVGVLQSFVAVARHRSFSRAGQELGLTQSAVSRQVASLEDLVGVRLFERTPQGLMLTDAGASYMPKVEDVLDRLDQATQAIRSYSATWSPLNVAIPPSLGFLWLTPRLHRFYRAHPEIGINLVSHNGPVDFTAEALDLAIGVSHSEWPGTLADRLFASEMVAVCSHEFRERHRLYEASDLARVPLLHYWSIPNIWQDWISQSDVDVGLPTTGVKSDMFSIAVGAAKSGIGLALAPRILVVEELQKGELIVPVSIKSKYTYNCMLFYPPDKRVSPSFQSFRTWLTRESKQFESQQQQGGES
jgi:LysR family transcriptional regulator, glycine cleavage system transcriptional activator